MNPSEIVNTSQQNWHSLMYSLILHYFEQLEANFVFIEKLVTSPEFGNWCLTKQLLVIDLSLLIFLITELQMTWLG